jgi:hypothetical protein
VNFPGDPEIRNKHTEKGIDYSAFLATYSYCSFNVAVYSYVPNFVPSRPDFWEWFVEDSQSSDLRAMNMTLRAGTDHNVSVNLVQAREFIGENEKLILKQRVFVVGAPPKGFNEYETKVVCPKGQESEALFSSFLDSFRFLDTSKQ